MMIAKWDNKYHFVGSMTDGEIMEVARGLLTFAKRANREMYDTILDEVGRND
jgi:hypothetical protein